MAHDGKLLARSRDIIANRKRENELEHSRRREELLASLPELSEIESELSRLMLSLAMETLNKEGNNSKSVIQRIRQASEARGARRAALLRASGFPENYLDEIYFCQKCHDSGYVLGKPCSCLEEIYKLQATRELSSMLDVQGQCFDLFDLNYYDTAPTSSGGASPRKTMSSILEICREYASNFGSNSVNLLFRGDTGLGKTFLSACIAKVVAEKGFSVVYDTSVSVMEAFETQKFDRSGENSQETASRIRRYLGCELLILDDLGTEMTTGFTQSALYTLINGRLSNGKKTIISTNLSHDEMARRYTPQTVSRIDGDYIALYFAGRDIRAIKREASLS